MATMILRPNGNITTDWQSDDYSYIDNNVTYPDTDTSDYAQAYGSEDLNDNFIVSMEDCGLDETYHITNIKIYAYGLSWDPIVSYLPQSAYFSVDGGSSWSSALTWGNSATVYWAIGSWDGDWTPAEIDAIRMRFRANTSEFKSSYGYARLFIAYVEITYELAPTTNINSVNTVEYANIAKIMTIDIDNIQNVMGIE